LHLLVDFALCHALTLLFPGLQIANHFDVLWIRSLGFSSLFEKIELFLLLLIQFIKCEIFVDVGTAVSCEGSAVGIVQSVSFIACEIS